MRIIDWFFVIGIAGAILGDVWLCYFGMTIYFLVPIIDWLSCEE